MTQMIFPVDATTECMVGWDAMLGTFFGQVYKLDDDGERIPAEDNGTILWVGTAPAQIRTVNALERAIKPAAMLTKEVRAELLAIEMD